MFCCYFLLKKCINIVLLFLLAVPLLGICCNMPLGYQVDLVERFVTTLVALLGIDSLLIIWPPSLLPEYLVAYLMPC